MTLARGSQTARAGVGIVLLIFACLLPARLRAAAGRTALDFLRLDIGPRQIAMGGAGAAVGGDVYSVTYNPALLTSLRFQELAFSHAQWLEGIVYQDFLYVHPTPAGAFNARLQHLGYGEITGYDAAGARQGELSASDTLMGISYARRLPAPGLSAGITFKFAREKLANVAAQAYLFDLGAAYVPDWGRLPSPPTFALAIRNLGPGVKFVQESHPVPAEMILGMSVPLSHDALLLTMDAHLVRANDPYVKFGGEYWVVDAMALRFGFEFPQDEGPGVRAGFGVRVRSIDLNYAFLPMGDLGMTHHVGAGYRFGGPAGKAYRRGVKLLREKKYSESILRFNEALDNDPRHPDAGRMMRRAYRLLKQAQSEAEE